MNDQPTPTRSDYIHVKALALIAILATQIPILMLSRPSRRSQEIHTDRKYFPITVGQKLYGFEGNPIDGIKTNWVQVTAVSNGWVRIQYENEPMSLVLRDDVIEACFEPVSRLQKGKD